MGSRAPESWKTRCGKYCIRLANMQVAGRSMALWCVFIAFCYYCIAVVAAGQPWGIIGLFVSLYLGNGCASIFDTEFLYRLYLAGTRATWLPGLYWTVVYGLLFAHMAITGYAVFNRTPLLWGILNLFMAGVAYGYCTTKGATHG